MSGPIFREIWAMRETPDFAEETVEDKEKSRDIARV